MFWFQSEEPNGHADHIARCANAGGREFASVSIERFQPAMMYRAETDGFESVLVVFAPIGSASRAVFVERNAVAWNETPMNADNG